MEQFDQNNFVQNEPAQIKSPHMVWAIVITAILVAVLVGVGVYMLQLQRVKNLEKQLSQTNETLKVLASKSVSTMNTVTTTNNTVSNTTTSKATNNASDYSSWQSYSDSQIEFKYPNNWKIQAGYGVTVAVKDLSFSNPLQGSSMIFNITYSPVGSNITLESMEKDNSQLTKTSSLTISGYQASKYNDSSGNFLNTVYRTIGNNLLLTVYSSQTAIIDNQIIASIKIKSVNSTNSDQTSKSVSSQDIKNAFSKKYPNINYSPYTIKIDKYTDTYARGSISSGAGWFAKKINGVWTIVADGQAINCSDLDSYGFPKDFKSVYCG
ncbi:MAG: hypothetical protein COU31_04330 [Candidatus Magasanikbacteria bacterium CG10_big_fil_rev_8_21_14_0_10_40_10]|uniref:Uncharacterized protein n=1 Tax=Candidatus Magasanikbacteria bacterium CG10_big_fil_rev_8_21_14_0_10_40_10 TaxID=1974648 RepID=A0A2M6W2Z0_9BACT|nr:MAG: hypothetical protein COU31_04330 [Candidatus Magasanikbacteria bacterium CG10_big_fil_rev_8_21_14_0_10_40_10]